MVIFDSSFNCLLNLVNIRSEGSKYNMIFIIMEDFIYVLINFMFV